MCSSCSFEHLTQVCNFARKNMVKAEEKKQNNIAEYIVHMYQSEELVRAYSFDLNQINTYVISHIPLDDEPKKELLLWYAALIETMQNEGIQTSGHLNETKQLVDQLNKLHEQLLTDDEAYAKIANAAQPHIKQQIKEAGNTITNPIQICLNAVYGFLLLQLNGKSVSTEQQTMLDVFGDMLSFLSYKFKQGDFLTSN